MTDHLDFYLLASGTITAAGTDWTASGLTLPAPIEQAVVLKIGPVKTAVFEEARLYDTDGDVYPVTIGQIPSAENGQGLPLSAIGVSGIVYQAIRVGLTSGRELAIAGTGISTPYDVAAWALRADDISVDALDADLLTRVLPVPTEARAGFTVKVNAAGDGYELADDGGGPSGGGTSPRYATAAQYRDRIGSDQDGKDDLLGELLDAASREIDRELLAAPGHFAPIPADAGDDPAAYTFDGNGHTTLRLRDAAGGYLIRELTAATIDGATVPVADLILQPRNAGTVGQPFTAVQRVGGRTWPDGATVELTGRWGWATTPPLIRELTVKVAQDIRDSHKGGSSGTVAILGEGVEYRDETWRIWVAAKRAHTQDTGARR
ncbi:MAG: hypothetical protein OXG38_02895 [Chloroflexi bacterium]|nr:hypothetical protein [Chloroflexota bacterium]